MALSDLASLGSFVSGVAVLASLIFLFFQMRQMTEQVRRAERNQRALMQQGRANRVCDTTLKIAEPEMSVIFGRGMAGDKTLSAQELARFLNMCRVGLLSGEDSFLQHRSGALDDAAFESYLAGAHTFMTLPGMRAAWRMSAHQFGGEYRRFMDEIMSKTAPIEPGDGIAQWKAELAKDATLYQA